MSTNKSPTEGGSGGKRGHSNMEHWDKTEEIKQSCRIVRRRNDKREIANGIAEQNDNSKER